MREGCMSNEAKRKQELLEALNKRLHERELQAAKYGVNADPIIQIEIDEIKSKMAMIEGNVTENSRNYNLESTHISAIERNRLSSLLAEFSTKIEQLTEESKLEELNKIAAIGDNILKIDPKSSISLDLAQIYLMQAKQSLEVVTYMKEEQEL